jgi:hypothetical protein
VTNPETILAILDGELQAARRKYADAEVASAVAAARQEVIRRYYWVYNEAEIKQAHREVVQAVEHARALVDRLHALEPAVEWAKRRLKG